MSAGSRTNPELEFQEYSGDPNELVSYAPQGTADYLYTFESYEQLRDYSDSAVLGRLRDVRVVREPSTDGLGAGQLEFDFDLIAVVGGKSRVVGPTAAADYFSVRVRLLALPEVIEQIPQRFAPLLGRARYLMFLSRGVEQGTDGEAYWTPFYVPMYVDDALSWVLAERPAGGTFGVPLPKPYVVEAALDRGEEVTGTSQPEGARDYPDFADDEGDPSGLSAQEIVDAFAAEQGTTSTPPPPGWDRFTELASTFGDGPETSQVQPEVDR